MIKNYFNEHTKRVYCLVFVSVLPWSGPIELFLVPASAPRLI